MRLRNSLILLFSFCAVTAFSAEPRIGKFTQYDAGEFVIVTSRSGAQARRFMDDLVKFRLALERALGRRANQNEFPTTILITSGSDWNDWLRPRQNIAGYFQKARFSNFMAMNGDAPLEEAVHVMFHEYTHYFLSSRFAGEYPPWFNEGLAELMGYAKFDKGMAILRIPMQRVYEARDGDWIPFERLLRVDQSDPEYQSHKLAPSFYAQAWLTVHYGLVENREFGKQMLQYLNELNMLVAQPDAARKAFGNDLSVPDRQLRDYSRASNRSSGAINLGEVQEVQIADGKPVGELDALALFADVMLETRLAPDRIRPLVDSLERRDPNVARAAILAARLAQAADDNPGFDRAISRAEGALAPGDWEQRRELATVLLMSGIDTNPMNTRTSAQSAADLKRALKWFAEAVSHNNQDIEALWGFGTAATQLDRNLDVAEQALVTAYQLAPTSSDIAVSLANLKARQQKPEEMIPFLEDAARYASDLGTRRWAAETLVETEKFIVERDKVEAENKKAKEAYDKQVDEYVKKYNKARPK